MNDRTADVWGSRMSDARGYTLAEAYRQVGTGHRDEPGVFHL